MFDGKTGYTEKDVDFSDRTPDFEMLFDLMEDPGELRNLIDSQANTEVLALLRKKCAAHSQSLNRQRAAYTKAVQVKNR